MIVFICAPFSFWEFFSLHGYDGMIRFPLVPMGAWLDVCAIGILVERKRKGLVFLICLIYCS
jgi:hypothetical protein